MLAECFFFLTIQVLALKFSWQEFLFRQSKLFLERRGGLRSLQLFWDFPKKFRRYQKLRKQKEKFLCNSRGGGSYKNCHQAPLFFKLSRANVSMPLHTQIQSHNFLQSRFKCSISVRPESIEPSICITTQLFKKLNLRGNCTGRKLHPAHSLKSRNKLLADSTCEGFQISDPTDDLWYPQKFCSR